MRHENHARETMRLSRAIIRGVWQYAPAKELEVIAGSLRDPGDTTEGVDRDPQPMSDEDWAGGLVEAPVKEDWRAVMIGLSKAIMTEAEDGDVRFYAHIAYAAAYASTSPLEGVVILNLAGKVLKNRPRLSRVRAEFTSALAGFDPAIRPLG